MDRDTLARDLLTLPALVGAPGEVVRGLALRHPHVSGPVVVAEAGRGGWMLAGDGLMDTEPTPLDDLHAAGWRVDLDAGASAGVLLGLLGRGWCTMDDGETLPMVWHYREPDRAWEAPTLAEAAARALVEVARGR